MTPVDKGGQEELVSGRVLIWRYLLDLTPEEVLQLHQTLSPEERNRAASFRFDLHRNRYIVGRGILRKLLGRFLQLPPEAVEIVTGPYGKPQLADERATIRFNISHCEALWLCAITLDRELGIDLERIQKDLDVIGLAARFLAPELAGGLEQLAPPERERRFFQEWTRKEALAKARGHGLAGASTGEQRNFQIMDLSELFRDSDFLGALAVEGGDPVELLLIDFRLGVQPD